MARTISSPPQVSSGQTKAATEASANGTARRAKGTWRVMREKSRSEHANMPRLCATPARPQKRPSAIT